MVKVKIGGLRTGNLILLQSEMNKGVQNYWIYINMKIIRINRKMKIQLP